MLIASAEDTHISRPALRDAAGIDLWGVPGGEAEVELGRQLVQVPVVRITSAPVVTGARWPIWSPSRVGCTSCSTAPWCARTGVRPLPRASRARRSTFGSPESTGRPAGNVQAVIPSPTACRSGSPTSRPATCTTSPWPATPVFTGALPGSPPSLTYPHWPAPATKDRPGIKAPIKQPREGRTVGPWNAGLVSWAAPNRPLAPVKVFPSRDRCNSNVGH